MMKLIFPRGKDTIHNDFTNSVEIAHIPPIEDIKIVHYDEQHPKIGRTQKFRVTLLDGVNGSPRVIHRCHCPQGRALPQRRIPGDFEIDTNNLPLTEGKVHFIRRVLENGTISVLNEDNSFDKSLAHEQQFPLWL